MFLKHLFLQNFRSYTKSKFTFNHKITFIVGPNTSGKTNLIEAIYFLSTGKSFRAEKDMDVIQFGHELARVIGKTDNAQLEVVLTQGMVNTIKTPFKKYLLNDVSKHRVDFAGNLSVVLFKPDDLDVIVGSPGLRRNFLDEVLEQVSYEYRVALVQYSKGLRQRNALLERMREAGKRFDKQLEYWSDLLITNGQLITQKREELIEFFEKEQKAIFDYSIAYDKSTISEERLLQYKEQEVLAANTLVGPHRDDVILYMDKEQTHDIRHFGSRGQQRLAIIQLKVLQLSFIEEHLGARPALLLDDFFSELDTEHTKVVLGIVDQQQTILTTTHREFIPGKILKGSAVIDLEK